MITTPIDPQAPVLSRRRYRAMSGRIERYEAACEKMKGTRAGFWTPAEVRAACRLANLRAAPTNEERSFCEVYRFVHDPPDRYFLYVNEGNRVVTTWVGHVLGQAHFGRPYKAPGFGRFQVRVPVRVRGINGREYAGTYYKSTGDYARVKLIKGGK